MDMAVENTGDSCSKQLEQRELEEEQEKEEEEPLHEFVVESQLVKNRAYHRAFLALRVALFIVFLTYRLRRVCMACDDSSSLLHGCKLELLAMACEVCFGLSFLLSVSYKWSVVERKAYPDRLLSRWGQQLPRVDVFVTTADPIKEPPLITINTVLSALALHYPAHKMACYVSDDGGSLLTLWALKEAASFAKSWVPFCNTFSSHVYPRAPGRYFALESSCASAKLHGFYKEWHAIKEEYYALENHIQSMSAAYCKSKNETLTFLLNGLLETTTIDGQKATYSSWAMNYDPSNHSSYCEILLDKHMDLPYLVYMSREKRPKKKHHSKAGAMNALLRVSGIMTNAPYIMNLDCDMYVNEAKALLQAMCFFMQPTKSQDGKRIGFVQFPQCFESINADDKSQLAGLFEIILKGMDAIQGPLYCGTGCIHKREVLYGRRNQSNSFTTLMDGSKFEEFLGHSQILIMAAQSLLTNQVKHHSLTQDALMTESIIVMECSYEDKTSWGKEVGLIYGSLTEDIMTSTKIHSRGWGSLACTPSPPAFIGLAPSTSEDALIMRKRWTTGALQCLFSRHIFLLIDSSNGLSLIQRIIYLSLYTSTLPSFILFIYAILPSISIVQKSQIYPQIANPGLVIPISLVMCCYIGNFYENKLAGVGVKQWWSSEIMENTVALTSSTLAFYEVIKNKVIGSEQTTFSVTPKEQNSHVHGAIYPDDDIQGQAQQGLIVNRNLPLFIPATVVALLNMTSLVVATTRTLKHLIMDEPFWSWSLSTELACSMWILYILQPFSKGVVFWALGQEGPLTLSSSTIFHSSCIAMALLSLVLISSLQTLDYFC